MEVPVFRSLVHFEGDPHGYHHLDFEPIEPDDPRDLIGSGPHPWIMLDVPDGSRVAPATDQSVALLHVPEDGEETILTAAEAVMVLASEKSEPLQNLRKALDLVREKLRDVAGPAEAERFLEALDQEREADDFRRREGMDDAG